LKAAARATRLLYLADGRIVGDLNLGQYTEESRKERENTIYTFLKENNW
jgi:putative ABC transport system ATP-binding protein